MHRGVTLAMGGVLVGFILMGVVDKVILNKVAPQVATSSSVVSSVESASPPLQSLAQLATLCTVPSLEYLKKAEDYFKKASEGAAGGWDSGRNYALLASAATELYRICTGLEEKEQKHE